MDQDLEALGTKLDFFLRTARVRGEVSLSQLHEYMEQAFRQAGFRKEGPENREKILILRLDAMGDNILTTPVLRELRRNRPHAHIVLVTSPAAYPLMELCPYVDEVYSFALSKWKEKGIEALASMAAFCRTYLWQERYDLCICPCWGSKPTEERCMAYLSGAKERWGYSDLVNNFYMPEPVRAEEEIYLLTHAICNPPELIHEADRCIYMLEAMGMAVEDRKTEVWLAPRDVRWARKALGSMGQDGYLAALCVGAKDLNRKYPLEQWCKVMESIIRLGGRFVILGGAQERMDGDFLGGFFPEGYVLNLAGRTTMRESVAVLSLSDFYMGNVTGMMHAAAACGTPVIAIYREAEDRESVCTGVCSEFSRFAPYGVDYIALRPKHALEGCRDVICYGGCLSGQAHCIKQVSPDEVVEAFRRMTAGRRPRGKVLG